jgi:hypothetical protein
MDDVGTPDGGSPEEEAFGRAGWSDWDVNDFERHFSYLAWDLRLNLVTRLRTDKRLVMDLYSPRPSFKQDAWTVMNLVSPRRITNEDVRTVRRIASEDVRRVVEEVAAMGRAHDVAVAHAVVDPSRTAIRVEVSLPSPTVVEEFGAVWHEPGYLISEEAFGIQADPGVGTDIGVEAIERAISDLGGHLRLRPVVRSRTDESVVMDLISPRRIANEDVRTVMDQVAAMGRADDVAVAHAAVDPTRTAIRVEVSFLSPMVASAEDYGSLGDRAVADLLEDTDVLLALGEPDLAADVAQFLVTR